MTMSSWSWPGFVDTVSSRRGVVFEVYGAAMVEALLNALAVVKAFDVVEQRSAQRGSGRPCGALVDPGQFTFEGGEERLDGCVVVAAANRAEGLLELEFGEPSGEGQ